MTTDRNQKLLDSRLTRMADVADTAGWTDLAAALRERVGRKAAKTWTRDLGRTLAGIYDPEDPQRDKAARAAWLFTRAFSDERFAEPDALASYLQTTVYWAARHLAAAGVDGLDVTPAPTAAAAKPKAKRRPAAKKKAGK